MLPITANVTRIAVASNSARSPPHLPRDEGLDRRARRVGCLPSSATRSFKAEPARFGRRRESLAPVLRGILGRPLAGDGGAVELAAEIVVVVECLIVRLIDVSPIDVIDGV